MEIFFEFACFILYVFMKGNNQKKFNLFFQVLTEISLKGLMTGANPISLG